MFTCLLAASSPQPTVITHPTPPTSLFVGDDRAAAQRNLDIQFGVFADPLFLGKYPDLLQRKFGSNVVKEFTQEEAAMVKGSADFLGEIVLLILGVFNCITLEDMLGMR